MNRRRDLMDVRNLGEFAFTLSAIGLMLAVIAFVTAFFSLYFLNVRGRVLLGGLSVAIWIVLVTPSYLSLRRRSTLWVGEQRATKQVSYVEWSTFVMLGGLSLFSGNAVGSRELMLVLECLFSSWILVLLACQVFLHFALGYRIRRGDAIRWGVMLAYVVYNLLGKFR